MKTNHNKRTIYLLAVGLMVTAASAADKNTCPPGLAHPVAWQDQIGSCNAESGDAGAPQIAAVGESTYPGETLIVTGTGLSNVSLRVRAGDDEMTLKPLYSADDRMLATLPANLPLAAMVIWPVLGERTGKPIRINAPVLWWHWPLRITNKTGELHVMGRNFKLKDEDQVVYLDGPGFQGMIRTVEVNPYQLTVRLPGTLAEGSYRLFVWSGTDLGWSDPMAIKVEEDRTPAPAVAASAGTFGAVPDDDQDDALALQKALDALSPGGTLLLEKGTYLLSRPLTVSIPGVTIRGAGAGEYDSAASQMSGTFSMLRYQNVRELPSSLIEVRAAGVEMTGLAAENGNNGNRQTVISVYAPDAKIHKMTLVMQDKREWGFSEPGPNFGTRRHPKSKLTQQVIDTGVLLIDCAGRADTLFSDSEVHASGPGVQIGTLQAFDLEKENEPAARGVLIERVRFSGYYAGEPNEKKNPGGSGRAVGVMIFNGKECAVRNCFFQSADRANRKIMCRTVLSLNTSTKNLYLADNRSVNVGSHPSAIGMDRNQGEQYLFHYRYPPGGLFDVIRAGANSLTLDPSRADSFEPGDKFSKAHYFISDRGSRVLDEVGQNDNWIVFICAGKGMGQYREVTAQEKDGGLIRLTLDSPWRVVPDETSRFNLTPAYRHVVVFRNFIDTGDFIQTHKTHGVTFWFYAMDNIVAGNHFKNLTSGIVFNSRFRGPTAWNLTRENVIENISGYCGDTSLKPAGYVDHFRVTLDWPKPENRVTYSIGNAARSNRIENADVGAYLHARFTGEVWGGLPPVEHSTGGMVMSVIENSVFTGIHEDGIVVDTPANGCLVKGNSVQMDGGSPTPRAVVIGPLINNLHLIQGATE
jgi:hypothetical protein